MFQKLWLFSNWLKFLLTYFRLNPKSQNSPGLSKFPLMVFVWIQVKRETYIQDMPTKNPEWERGHTQTHNPEWESPLKLQSLSRREQSTVTCKTLGETAIHGMKYMDICENFCDYTYGSGTSLNLEDGQNHSHDSECFRDLLPANCNLPKIDLFF